MEGVQNAGQVLPKDVRVVSVAKECCSIEINDPGAGMVLDVVLFLAWESVNVSRLLIVDDDVEVLALLKKFFVQHAYEVDVAADGEAMWAAIAQQRPDTIILDLMLPGEGGLSLCQKVRAQFGIPIIMLTAMGELSDRIVGLELGADDYLTKPFSPRELAARVKALLRRAGAPAAALAAAPALLHDDAAGQRISLRGEPLALTRREYRLLACLLAGAGRIHARETLLAAAWGDESDSHDRTVDTHIKTLRAKLREADPSREYIQTHRGMGYCLNL